MSASPFRFMYNRTTGLFPPPSFLVLVAQVALEILALLFSLVFHDPFPVGVACQVLHTHGQQMHTYTKPTHTEQTNCEITARTWSGSFPYRRAHGDQHRFPLFAHFIHFAFLELQSALCPLSQRHLDTAQRSEHATYTMRTIRPRRHSRVGKLDVQRLLGQPLVRVA